MAKVLPNQYTVTRNRFGNRDAYVDAVKFENVPPPK
jgi:hypothetical protein